jgi:PhnB protein
MPVPHVPSGYHAVTPYLIVNGAASALDFYKRAFGATEVLRVDGPDGCISHAELLLGDSHVMLADEFPAMGFRGPVSYGGTPVLLMLYVPDVDERCRLAVQAGARVLRPLADQFYGDRTATLLDPFGHIWTVATHKEDVPPDELARRAAAQPKPGTT